MRSEGGTGSGPRANVYALHLGPAPPADLDTGNAIEIIGDPAEFARSNPGIEPAPPAEYFVDKP